MTRRILFYLGWQLTLAVFLLSVGIHVSCSQDFKSEKGGEPEVGEYYTAMQAGCEDDPVTYGAASDGSNVICVDAGSTAATIDICQSNTIQTTIQAAINTMPNPDMFIFIFDGLYKESLSFSGVSASLIGCTKAGVSVGNPDLPTIDTHTFDVEAGSDVSVFNMTVQGIGVGYSATGTETADALSNAATFFVSDSSVWTANLELKDNFYQAFKLAANSTGTLITVDFSTPYSASNTNFPNATNIAIWNEAGTLSVSGLTFGTTFDTGIVSDGGTLTLAADPDGLTENTFSGMLTPIYLYNSAILSTSSDLTSIVITNSIVGIWSSDMWSNLSLSGLIMDGTNTYDLIGCQTTGTDAATVIYNLNYNTLPTLIFGTVTVEGGGSGTTTEANVLGTVYVDETTVLNDQFATYGTSPYIVSCNRGDY